MPLKVVHFNNGSGGGVLTVIRNLFANNQNQWIENHLIYCINSDSKSKVNIPEINFAKSINYFYYSSNWNFYYTCKELMKILPEGNSVLVAHDWLELGMVSNLGLNKPVIYFLHGDYNYYYDLAINHQSEIDAFFCVASSIQSNLIKLLPNRKNQIFYHRFPVSDFIYSDFKKKINRIVFLGRCEYQKGYFLLPEIEKKIRDSGLFLEWHIIGEASDSFLNQSFFSPSANVIFHGYLKSDEVAKILSTTKFIILPSLSEGMPLSVIEAMKAGVVPIVNDIPGGLNEIVINGKTGFTVSENNTKVYAEIIIELLENENICTMLSFNASKLANSYFNAKVNTSNIEKQFILTGETFNDKVVKRVYGSRLDHPLIPNILTKTLRKIIKCLSFIFYMTIIYVFE